MKFTRTNLGNWANLPFFGAPLQDIETTLSSEERAIFPPAENVFRALELCPPERTKVLILGQDPYHTAGKADGLAFSIPNGFPGRLDSLGNIFKELESDLDVIRDKTDLTDWAQQGVLLLNTALTVIEGQAHAHRKLGWQDLVAQVLARLDDSPRAVLLWGNPAQKLGARLTHPDHLRIETAHPSPLSVHRGFFGSKPFSKVNHWLASRGENPINWA